MRLQVLAQRLIKQIYLNQRHSVILATSNLDFLTSTVPVLLIVPHEATAIMQIPKRIAVAQTHHGVVRARQLKERNSVVWLGIRVRCVGADEGGQQENNCVVQGIMLLAMSYEFVVQKMLVLIREYYVLPERNA